MKLDINSKIDKSEYPFTYNWDTVYRKNYA